MRRLVFRCDGGSSIGMGHIVRCSALAEMLHKDLEIVFVLQKTQDFVLEYLHQLNFKTELLPVTIHYVSDCTSFLAHLLPTDIVVLDGYHFETSYQEKIKNFGCKLVAIDDMHKWHQLADLVINHSNSAKKEDYSYEGYTKLLLGIEYLLLRSVFLGRHHNRRKLTEINNVMISMGAADVNNLTAYFAKKLLQIPSIKCIDLLVSDINPHLNEILALHEANSTYTSILLNLSATDLAHRIEKNDLIICPASSISLEACAIGVGIITGFTADNQLGILESHVQGKTAISLGDLNLFAQNDNMEELVFCINNVTAMNDCIESQSRLIDGKSGYRIREQIMNL
jgi:UDP-2,4-diacetamido-2,4,6-trideoxy-beta-L-altropyranose hydrolase